MGMSTLVDGSLCSDRRGCQNRKDSEAINANTCRLHRGLQADDDTREK